MTTDTNQTRVPAILVHKLNEPGALRIDSLSGRILSEPDERPDWAEGLAVALVASRTVFYMQRLGKLPNDTLDGLIAFEDLGWIAIDAEGGPIELEADAEYRMDKIAEATGINRSADLSAATMDNTDGELAHVLTSAHVGEQVTAGEATALEKALKEHFQAATGTTGG